MMMTQCQSWSCWNIICTYSPNECDLMTQNFGFLKELISSWWFFILKSLLTPWSRLILIEQELCSLLFVFCWLRFILRCRYDHEIIVLMKIISLFLECFISWNLIILDVIILWNSHFLQILLEICLSPLLRSIFHLIFRLSFCLILLAISKSNFSCLEFFISIRYSLSDPFYSGDFSMILTSH